MQLNGQTRFNFPRPLLSHERLHTGPEVYPAVCADNPISKIYCTVQQNEARIVECLKPPLRHFLALRLAGPHRREPSSSCADTAVARCRGGRASRVPSPFFWLEMRRLDKRAVSARRRVVKNNASQDALGDGKECGRGFWMLDCCDFEEFTFELRWKCEKDEGKHLRGARWKRMGCRREDSSRLERGEEMQSPRSPRSAIQIQVCSGSRECSEELYMGKVHLIQAGSAGAPSSERGPALDDSLYLGVWCRMGHWMERSFISLNRYLFILTGAFVPYGESARVVHEGRRESELEQNRGNVRAKPGGETVSFVGCLTATGDEKNGTVREREHERCLVCAGQAKIGGLRHIVLWKWFSESTRRESSRGVRLP
ncbi:hypothetical protein C8J57DRAFT_1227656 [Mycena rebaudengoi]|nr:hypothetical protein C8J57DRAFT_1227656 [Mycena rebaudengoi]